MKCVHRLYKVIVSAAILLFTAGQANAQATWVHHLGFDHTNGQLVDDPVCGIRYASNSPDGSVYILTKYAPGIKGGELLKYDWINGDTLWHTFLGGAGWFWWCDFVKATSDSGCISAVNHVNSNGEASTAIIKLSKSGAIDGAETRYYGLTGSLAIEITESSTGNF